MINEEGKITIPIYELVTSGSSVNGWSLRGISKLVFLDKQAAAEHIESFEEKWYDDTYFECAIPGTLKTEIRKRTLIVSRHVLERILQENTSNDTNEKDY